MGRAAEQQDPRGALSTLGVVSKANGGHVRQGQWTGLEARSDREAAGINWAPKCAKGSTAASCETGQHYVRAALPHPVLPRPAAPVARGAAIDSGQRPR